MKSYILLENIILHAKHGFYKQENMVGNTFIIDLKVAVENYNSLQSDDLSHTVSYADLYAIIKKEMSIPSKLLEHIAGRIIKEIREKHPSVKTIEIKLAKQNPPLGGNVEKASVILIDDIE